MKGEWCDYLSRPGKRRRPYPDSKMKPEGFGIPSGEHPIVRCPRCNRRLRLKAVYGGAYEFLNWRLPKHKTRVTRRPGPTRNSSKKNKKKG